MKDAPLVNWVEAPPGACPRVKGACDVVHAAGLYEGPGDDRLLARCQGAFRSSGLTYPIETTMVTCLWCIVEADGYGLHW